MNRLSKHKLLRSLNHKLFVLKANDTSVIAAAYQ